MGLGKSFTMALSSIINNKVRALLTMLGIIIGIAAVIILVSVMNGLTNEITSMFDDFGTTSLTANIMTRSANIEVKPDEVYEFADANPDMYSGVSPQVMVSGQIKLPTSGDDAITSSCSGVSEDYYDIKRLELGFGRFICNVDCDNKSRSAVIGSYQALYLFGTCEDALNKTIKINGIPFTVIGILEEEEDSTQSSSDNAVYIPYTTALQMNGTNRVNTYIVDAADDSVVDEAKAKLESFLLEKIGDDDFYNVTSLKVMIDAMTNVMGKMTMVLVAIAGISLLVGGIGIMNIMLVTVSERTREIGIRKALGAKHRHIMTQFVMESGVVSCIGGIIGIIIGSAFAMLAGKALGMAVRPSTGAITIAFCVSVGIGIIFGFLPARKAARLNPIDALRSE
ncbi:MAG: ABC transporter permease [Oscillospiraceae bacterium]|nr:ABC transporter permease [Oscillospiraceae bacterium]